MPYYKLLKDMLAEDPQFKAEVAAAAAGHNTFSHAPMMVRWSEVCDPQDWTSGPAVHPMCAKMAEPTEVGLGLEFFRKTISRTEFYEDGSVKTWIPERIERIPLEWFEIGMQAETLEARANRMEQEVAAAAPSPAEIADFLAKGWEEVRAVVFPVADEPKPIDPRAAVLDRAVMKLRG